MSERWQQWMPFHIDKFRGSPEVQAMHPTARAGYLYLLASAWQSPDCTISSDPLDLSAESGLGEELWDKYRPRILRKFEDIAGGKLRNYVLYAEWSEAKRIFEARQASAVRTNTARSPSRSPHRPADTITLTGTVTSTEKHKDNGHPIAPEMITQGVLSELCLSGRDLAVAISEVCRAEMARGALPGTLRDEMIAAWREYEIAKPKLSYTKGAAKFYGDGDWRNKDGWPWKDGHSAKPAKRVYLKVED